MNYTVVWLLDAEQALAAIWLSATDRAQVTRAADLLDQRLRRDPENEGASDRVIFEATSGGICSRPDESRMSRVKKPSASAGPRRGPGRQ